MSINTLRKPLLCAVLLSQRRVNVDAGSLRYIDVDVTLPKLYVPKWSVIRTNNTSKNTNRRNYIVLAPAMS